jgi:hypothetical protein
MWVVNAQVMVQALFSPWGMGLFFPLLILSMILGMLATPGDGRTVYRLVSIIIAGLALMGIAWGLMQPATRFGGPKMEVVILGVVGLPPLLGWVAGWATARFLSLGLDRPQDSPTA